MNIRQFVRKNLKVESVMGPEWLCLCPYHNDSNASFCVNVRKGVFICYSCGKSGNIYQLEKFLNTGDYVEQTTSTATEVKRKIESLKKAKPAKLELVSDSEIDFFRLGDHQYKKWLDIRKISSTTVDKFLLGYDQMRDALVIPVRDYRTGKVVSFIHRNLDTSDGSPKYKYRKGFKISQNLFGAWQCVVESQSMQIKKIAIVEGSIDALSMWEVGCPAVAILGASPSTKQINILKALSPVEYVIMTDRDRAGREAGLKLETALKKAGVVISYPSEWDWSDKYKDPDSLPPENRVTSFINAKRVKAKY